MSTTAMSNTYKDRAVEVLRASWQRPPRRWRCSHRACGSAAAVAYVRANCTSQVRIGDVAAAASMSVVQLERATRRIIGLSVRQLLVRFRVEYAIGLLATTDQTLSDIAERCGYYDQSAFTRQFRRVVGVSPGAYRSQILRR